MRSLASMVLLPVVLVGCQSPTSPTWHRQRSTGNAAAPPVLRQPATLEIRNASAIRRRESLPGFPFDLIYDLEFDLVETGGESGAMIRTIQTSIADEQEELTDADCFGGLRVGAGNFLRIDKSIGWCAPLAVGRAEVNGVSLEVSFVDDYLRSGTIRAVVPVKK